MTTYKSSKFNSFEEVIPYVDLYPLIINQMNNISIINGYDHTDREITYNGTRIEYSLFFSPSTRRYFLSFIPKNVWNYSTRTVLIPAFQNTANMFSQLPNKIKINNISFQKAKVSGTIDISNWGLSTIPDCGFNTVKSITELSTINKIGEDMLNYYKEKILDQLLIIDAMDGKSSKQYNKMIEKIKPLFKSKPICIKYDESTLEKIDVRMDKHRLFIFILKYGDYFDQDSYKKYKQYFISNNIKSQVIDIRRYDQIIDWGFENLILEILKKAFFEDKISLDPQQFGIVDGFLCLSDVQNENNDKLFGVSISYSGKGTTDDWLEVYNDIDYQTYRNRINFEKKDIESLAAKIIALSNMKNTAIDIYVTKRWKTNDVGDLTRILSDNDIFVRRFFYLSKKTHRFLFTNLANLKNYNQHSYAIWDGRIASIQTNSKITLYGTLFPVHVELLNPWTSGELMVEDLELILWLTKKRIYRIMNFYNLKIPEILSIFDQVNTLDLSGNITKMRVNLHSLI